MVLCSIATPSVICGFYGFPKWTSKVLCSYLTMSVALNYEFIHRFEARKSDCNNITEFQQASPSLGSVSHFSFLSVFTLTVFKLLKVAFMKQNISQVRKCMEHSKLLGTWLWPCTKSSCYGNFCKKSSIWQFFFLATLLFCNWLMNSAWICQLFLFWSFISLCQCLHRILKRYRGSQACYNCFLRLNVSVTMHCLLVFYLMLQEKVASGAEHILFYQSKCNI